MQGHGVDVDPVTGRPMAEAEALSPLNEREKKSLAREARFSEVDASEAAEALREMLRARLERRIGEVLAGDPEASAYVSILRELHERADLAKRAVNQLVSRGYL
jgi:hypothetical protein